MELRFVAPDLRRLDETSAEVIACGVLRDERPLSGLAGLADWRLAGRLSRLLQKGFLLGDVGEVVVVPARPRLPFDKLLAYGVGPRASFDEAAYKKTLARVLDAIAGLQVKTALVELPGRGQRLIEPERAIDLLFDATGPERPDVLSFVEDADGQRRMLVAVEGRRRGSLRPPPARQG